MSARLHVLIDGKSFGPYPEDEFRQHVKDRRIVSTDLVWREGLADWVAVGQFLENPSDDSPPLKVTRNTPVISAKPSRSNDELLAGAAAGVADDQFQVGLRHELGQNIAQDYTQALVWYRKAAEQGHGRALFHLGLCHATGKGGARDEAESLRCLREAAERGHAEAQLGLAYLYDQGQGMPSDNTEAFRWYRKAAEQGHPVAQNNLALMYASGRGVPANPAEALRWFRQAAEQGQVGAQFNLGILYADGQGATQDFVEAYKWFNLAAARGHSAAAQNRDQLVTRMTRDQVAEGQRRAVSFTPRQPSLEKIPGSTSF